MKTPLYPQPRPAGRRRFEMRSSSHQSLANTTHANIMPELFYCFKSNAYENTPYFP
jgi:hypothetical protein